MIVYMTETSEPGIPLQPQRRRRLSQLGTKQASRASPKVGRYALQSGPFSPNLCLSKNVAIGQERTKELWLRGIRWHHSFYDRGALHQLTNPSSDTGSLSDLLSQVDPL